MLGVLLFCCLITLSGGFSYFFFFSSRRRHTRLQGDGVQTCALPIFKYANAFWPAPSTPDRPDGTAIAYSNPPQTIGESLGLARFDYVISSKDSFYANLTIDNGLRINPWGGGGGGAPNFKSVSDNISKTLSLKETHVFSSSLVNIATLGYAGGYATLVNAPAVPMPADVVFLEGGNPGTISLAVGSARPPRPRWRAYPATTPLEASGITLPTPTICASSKASTPGGWAAGF